MSHYNITIITSKPSDTQVIKKLKEEHKVLLVDKNKHYRNTIKTNTGFVVILHHQKKNIQITTDILLDLS